MEITIVHSWSDKNKGDSGILFGMLNYFNSSLNPKKVHILPIPHSDYLNSLYQLNEIKEKYPFYIGKPYRPIELYSENVSKPIKLVQLVTNWVRFQLILKFPNSDLFIKKSEFKTLEMLRNTDVVISKGGHIFHVYSLKNHIRLYRDTFILKFASKLGKQIIIGSQSFGPFKTRGSRKIFKEIVELSDTVLCRETISIERLKSISSSNSIGYFPDFAFNMKEDLSCERYKDLSGKIGITVRQHIFTKSSEEDYLNGFKHLIKELVQRGEKVVIIPHCIGPTVMEDDRIISKKLYDETLKDHMENVEYFEGAQLYNAIELMNLYSNLKVMVGTRFHSIIFALISTVPSFAISYSGPKANIMKDFGLQEYIADIEDVYNKKSYILSKVEELIKNEKSVRGIIRNGLDRQMKYFKNSIF